MDRKRPFRAPTPSDVAQAQEYFQKGNQRLRDGQLDLAELCFQQAVDLYPDFSEAQCNLGTLLKDRWKLEGAEVHLNLALQTQPDLRPALFNLALLYIDQKRWHEAADLLRRSLELNSTQADDHYWLGNAEMGMGNMLAAQQSFDAAIRLHPGYVQARWGRLMALIPAIAEAETDPSLTVKAFQNEFVRLRKWFDANKSAKGFLAVGAQQPYYLAYINGNHRALLAVYGELCCTLMAKWAKQVRLPPAKVVRSAKCRVGIVSAHVHSHSVWHAVVRGWVEHLDPEKFEIHIFHTGTLCDAETDWARKRVAHLHYAVSSWPEWATLISNSQLNALIYPEIGMDATTVRLSSLRLAPVQLAAWGHPITTGLPTIDAYISADGFEPSDGHDHYVEDLIRLPRLGCCYQAFSTKSQKIDIHKWRIDQADRILLCAGAPFKYAPAHDKVWLEIAKRCTPCKLIFFTMAGDHLSNQFQNRLQQAFDSGGIDWDASVRFIPWQPQSSFFGFLDIADVYLDTLDFSGFNTVMQAAERSTPVVAYEGAFMRGRFASAVLRSMGLAEWIADSQEKFIEMAVQIATNPALQNTLRKKVKLAFNNLLHDKQTIAALGSHLLRLTSR